MASFAIRFCKFHFAMLVQSGILVGCLLLLDLVLRRRTRAVVRYALWLLVLVKLVLPTSLSLPTGLGYWVPRQGDLPRTARAETAVPVEPLVVPALSPSEESETATSGPAPEAVVPPSLVSAPEVVVAASVPAPAEPDLWPAELTAPPEEEAEPATTARPPVPRPWQLQLFWGWLGGVIVLLALLLHRYRVVGAVLAKSSQPVREGEIYELLEDCRRRVGLRRPVVLRLTHGMMSPAVCGLRRPLILLPASFLTELAPGKLRAVFTHELAHVKRGDLWVNLAQSLLQIAYFFNPFLWLANARIRSLREKAVDEMALGNLDGDATAYSAALVDIAEIAFSRPRLLPRLVGVVESRHALGDRIRHILSRRFPPSARLGLLGIAVVVVLAAVLLPMGRNRFRTVRAPAAYRYEEAPGSVNGEIQVGPSRFRIRSTARYTRSGEMIARQPDGSETIGRPAALPTLPEAAKWLDIATIQWAPDPAVYDLVELRLFDHQSRRELEKSDCPSYGYTVDGSTLTVYGVGRFLPDRLDIWLRVLHRNVDQPTYRLLPAQGQEVRFGRRSLRIESVLETVGVGDEPCANWAATTTIQCDYQGSGVSGYQICAVGKDGHRAIPALSSVLRNPTGRAFFEFPMARAAIDHFELRPDLGRDTFFFDGVTLPPRREPLDAPPPIRFEINGAPGTYRDSAFPLPPLELVLRENAQVCPSAARATDIGGDRANCSFLHLPPNTALVFHRKGTRFVDPVVTILDRKGNPLEIARHGQYGGSTFFAETPHAASQIQAVELRLDRWHLSFPPHFVGITGSDGEALYDRDGKVIGKVGYAVGGDRSAASGNHVLLFDFPITEEPIQCLDSLFSHPTGEAETAQVQAFASFGTVDCYEGRQRLVIDAKIEREYMAQRPFPSGNTKRPLERFDYTLSYYYGPCQGFDFSFRGPLLPGAPIAEDDGKPYALTVRESTETSWPHKRKVHFTLSGPLSLSLDTPLVYYDAAGLRHVLPHLLYLSLRQSSTKDTATLDFDVFDISLADIARFGSEIPSRISVPGIRTHFVPSDGSARETDLGRLSAFCQPKSPPVSYSEDELAHIRQIAGVFVAADSAFQHLVGLSAGLKGGWPEFVDPALAVLTGEYAGFYAYTIQYGVRTGHIDADWAIAQEKAQLADGLKSFPHLDRHQLGEVAEAIRQADDPQVLSNLFALLWKTDAIPTIEVCQELATDDRPWIWLQAISIWGGQTQDFQRGQRTYPEDFPEALRLRMALAQNGHPPADFPTFYAAHRMIPGILNARFLYTGRDFRELWYKLVTVLGREEGTAVIFRFLEEAQTPAAQDLFFHSLDDYRSRNQLISTVVDLTRHLNAWYGIDLHGLGDQPFYGGGVGAKPGDQAELLTLVRDVLAWHRQNPDAKLVPLVIQGRVVDRVDGTGIAGATVRLIQVVRTKPYSGYSAAAGECTSDADGTFVFANPENNGWYSLQISAPGHEPTKDMGVSFRTTGKYLFGEDNVVYLSRAVPVP